MGNEQSHVHQLLVKGHHLRGDVGAKLPEENASRKMTIDVANDGSGPLVIKDYF